MQDKTPFDEIRSSIRSFDSLFYYFSNERLVTMFSHKVGTAGVYLKSDEDSDDMVRIEVYFNPDFWAQLNHNEKVFIFIHEAMHMILNHGKRGYEFKDGKANQQLVNICQDICINHIIEDQFLKIVPRSAMPIVKDACFIDTVFGEHAHKIKKGKSFEYYYDEYVKLFGIHEFANDSIDDHSGLESLEDVDEEIQEELEDILEDSHVLQSEELEGNDETIQASKDFDEPEKNNQSFGETDSTNCGSGESPSNVSLEDVFNFVIKDAFIERKSITKNRTWYGYDRRTTPLTQTMSEDLILPVVNRKVEKEKKVHRVCVYPDVSGSCSFYTDKLISLILNMDTEKFQFDVYPWADYVGFIKVYNNNRFDWKGTGFGTNFHNVINDYKHRTKGLYDAYFVLTDGIYRSINNYKEDEYKNWYFFFTPDHDLNCFEKATHYVFDKL
jgi:hypothetical protein